MKTGNMKIEDVYSERVIERGEDYMGNVRSCIKANGSLFAEVHGSRLYKTKVDLASLEGECSCPYQRNCKHAVAAYLLHKKGHSVNADDFLKNLKKLDKEELIGIITSILPNNPELAADYEFRRKTNFGSLTDDLIRKFTMKKMEHVEKNLDRLNFGQLYKLLEFIEKEADSIFEEASAEFETYEAFEYDDDGQFLDDFTNKVTEEAMKRIDSEEKLNAAIRQRYLRAGIINNAERFYTQKSQIKSQISRKEYCDFLLNCKNPDIKELKESIVPESIDRLPLLPMKNLPLAERLATLLNNDDLHFMVSYQKEDLFGMIMRIDRLDPLIRKYLPIRASRIVDLIKRKNAVDKKTIRILFNKRHLEGYTPKQVEYLAKQIKDSTILLNNLDMSREFSKAIPIINRLSSLGYDIKKIFQKKDLLKTKHWTETMEIMRYIKDNLKKDYLADFIKTHKRSFAKSSTLKHNLKKEGIHIQDRKGKFEIEIY